MKRKRVLFALLGTAAVAVIAFVAVQLVRAHTESTVTMGQIIGTDSSRFSKLEIYNMGKYKVITDQQVMGNLLKTIAPIKLRHLTQDPKMIGGDFSLSLFPKDGAGAYVYADGGSGGFWKRDGCKFSGPEGIYPIQEASYSLWIDTMKNYYNTAPGTVEKVKTT